MKRARVAALCLALALLTFFQFPGHTWLQQDTQIYTPILEHQWDAGALRNDLLVQQPHVSFTLYDEVARLLRRVTRQGFREVLGAQQIATRALGIWGLYLLATALGLSVGPAFLVASICALGVMVTGPQVLSFEYEPTPRAFAVPLIFCAMGLTAQRRYLAGGVAAAAAFLYHPPTALPFWALYAVLPLRGRTGALRGLVPLAIAVLVLAAKAHGDGGQQFFGRLTPLQEQVQRMRAAYTWISTWHAAWMAHYCVLFALVVAAFARLRRSISLELEVFLLGLPVLGMLSMPVSWLLLEKAKWVLVPQVQPMRALLFVAVAMQLLCAAAGVRAVLGRRLAEGFLWFALAYAAAFQPVLTEGLAWRPVLTALLLGVAGVLAVRWPLLAVCAFFVFPVAYPALHTPALRELSAWARAATPRDAVFLFPDAGHGLAPGIFRAEGLRAVFVDWKGGGQVNYRKEFAEEWWRRWQLTMMGPVSMGQYAGMGIGYIVMKAQDRMPIPAVFENGGYVVYAVR